MELFVTKVNDCISFTFVTKSSILNILVLDVPLFRMGYILVTGVEKEALNRMKISHCARSQVFPKDMTIPVDRFF